tara:strand:+ start:313 stop:711 length:399 start_codon:yes stop_codon:yes gene_type:complete
MERIKRGDSKNAESLALAAKNELSFTISLKVDKNSASTIVRNIYESFRMLGDSLLILEGKESRGHLAPLNALMKLKVETGRPINLIENLRILRHNINYNGYLPTLIEVEDALSFAKSSFNQIYSEIMGKIKN